MPYIGGDPNRSALPVLTADISDDQITLAKLAAGTDGNIISYDASGNPVAIATGSDGQVLTSAGAGNPPAFENAAGGGITHASQWRLTTNFDGDKAPIDGNLEQVDAPSDGPFGTLGASMSESSGIFTFPSTGFWRVTFNGYWNNEDSNNDIGCLGGIQYTSNNSAYTSVAYQQGSIYGGEADNGEAPFNLEKFFDITDVSNQKVRFAIWVGNSNTKTICNTNENRT